MNAYLLIPTLLLSALTARTPEKSLDESSFFRPDKNHYPETFYHFIGGNLSKEGVDADLQALSDASDLSKYDNAMYILASTMDGKIELLEISK